MKEICFSNKLFINFRKRSTTFINTKLLQFFTLLTLRVIKHHILKFELHFRWMKFWNQIQAKSLSKWKVFYFNANDWNNVVVLAWASKSISLDSECSSKKKITRHNQYFILSSCWPWLLILIKKHLDQFQPVNTYVSSWVYYIQPKTKLYNHLALQFLDFQLKSFVDPKPVELGESYIPLKLAPSFLVWLHK